MFSAEIVAETADSLDLANDLLDLLMFFFADFTFALDLDFEDFLTLSFFDDGGNSMADSFTDFLLLIIDLESVLELLLDFSFDLIDFLFGLLDNAPFLDFFDFFLSSNALGGDLLDLESRRDLLDFDTSRDLDPNSSSVPASFMNILVDSDSFFKKDRCSTRSCS